MAGLIRDELFSRLLMAPAVDGCDELRILTGYASAPFALFHLLEIRQHLRRDISVRLDIGMSGEVGLDVSAHRAFAAAAAAVGGAWLRVRYAPRGTSDHSKIYVWLKNGVPSIAWTGSANYSASGFGLAGGRRETMTAVDPIAGAQTVDAAGDSFVTADDPLLFERVDLFQVVSPEVRVRVLADTANRSLSTLADAVSLPIVQTTGSPGQVHNAGGGLNWGQRGNRRRSEAYIPVPAGVSRSGFFPPRGFPFAVHTDDGQTMFLTIAQDGDKALHSVPDNATIGLWFRRRLGLGDDSFVSTVDLELYGNKQVEFTSLPDGAYFMDFPRGAEDA